tara:strand:+ start:47 stop:1273 length:1227 start_codon:yes stop_codon:yes gene_type:complete
MPFRKFGDTDLIRNTIIAYPKVNFFIYDGRVYYNNRPDQDGEFSKVYSSEVGSINLYEYNIDKLSGSNNFIYPYITKQSAGASFKTVGKVSYSNEFVYGDRVTGSYPMTASISREFMSNPSARNTETNLSDGTTFSTSPVHPHYYALRNRLNFLGQRSPHYLVSSSFGNKDNQNINLISIPSIAYGSRINPGSISLKWYLTGSLIGELKDIKENGELIQVGPEGSTGSGSVAGVALYDEGFILLTGSWDLNSQQIHLTTGGSTAKPQWIYYGAGAKDGISQATAGTSYVSASFDMSFEGHTETQVLTMFAHAGRGEVNFSNNPTFVSYDQKKLLVTSSAIFEENGERTIKNTVSSSFEGYEAPFERQVYVSRVAVYDESKNLIGVATLSSPVLKKENQDLSFKIKLDI